MNDEVDDALKGLVGDDDEGVGAARVFFKATGEGAVPRLRERAFSITNKREGWALATALRETDSDVGYELLIESLLGQTSLDPELVCHQFLAVVGFAGSERSVESIKHMEEHSPDVLRGVLGAQKRRRWLLEQEDFKRGVLAVCESDQALQSCIDVVIACGWPEAEALARRLLGSDDLSSRERGEEVLLAMGLVVEPIERPALFFPVVVNPVGDLMVAKSLLPPGGFWRLRAIGFLPNANADPALMTLTFGGISKDGRMITWRCEGSEHGHHQALDFLPYYGVPAPEIGGWVALEGKSKYHANTVSGLGSVGERLWSCRLDRPFIRGLARLNMDPGEEQYVVLGARGTIALDRKGKRLWSLSESALSRGYGLDTHSAWPGWIALVYGRVGLVRAAATSAKFVHRVTGDVYCNKVRLVDAPGQEPDLIAAGSSSCDSGGYVIRRIKPRGEVLWEARVPYSVEHLVRIDRSAEDGGELFAALLDDNSVLVFDPSGTLLFHKPWTKGHRDEEMPRAIELYAGSWGDGHALALYMSTGVYVVPIPSCESRF